MSTRRNSVHRRDVLRGLGSIAIGLPLLEVMGCQGPDGEALAALPRNAGALGSRRPPARATSLQRFIATMIPNGVVPDAWFPSGSGTTFETREIMDPLPEHGLPGLAEHRDDLVIFKGLRHHAASLGPEKSHNEGHACTLTGSVMQGPPGSTADAGWNLPGPSLDQYLAEHFETVAGVPFHKKSISITQSYFFNGQLSYDAQGNGIPAYLAVGDLFDDLFGLGDLSEGEREALRLRRHSVLDSVLGSYERLRGRLGSGDKARLEEHLDALRAVELRIDAQISCEKPADGTFFDPPGNADGDGLLEWADMMQDLVVLALACDATRVASIVYRACGGGASYLPWLGFSEDYDTGEHHEMSHRYQDPAWDPALVLAARWFCGQTARLIGKLQAVPEGTGTLFDSVLLFQGSDVATGHHTWDDMPYLLAGSGGGVIETGRYLELPEQTPHNALLVSILQAMGLADDTFGDAAPGIGPLPGLV